MIELKALQIDLANNEQKYNAIVNQRNGLNIEVFRMEGVIIYIKALINAIEQKTLEDKKALEDKKEKDQEK